MNEATLVILILLSIIITFCLYKMLDKRGLYFLIILFSIISFVLSFKVAYVLKMNINAGIIPLCALLSVLFLFISKYGILEKKNILLLTLYSNIIIALLLTVTNYFDPAITETISINMEETFQYNYKFLIAYPLVITLSEYIVIKLYNLVSQIQSNFIVSCVLTYIISSLIYTVLFYVIGYYNTIDIKYSLFIGISTYILGFIITIINTIVYNTMTKKKVI